MYIGVESLRESEATTIIAAYIAALEGYWPLSKVADALVAQTKSAETRMVSFAAETLGFHDFRIFFDQKSKMFSISVTGSIHRTKELAFIVYFVCGPDKLVKVQDLKVTAHMATIYHK